MTTTTNNTAGSKYSETRDLNLAVVAKLVRADIKALKIAGLVCSVRIDRFSGGQSMDVRVKVSPVQIWTDAYVASNPRDYFEGDRFTPEAKALLAQLEAVLQAYNRDDSDIQSDYFSVRFYGHAEFSSDATRADRETTIARNVTESRAAVVEAEAAVAACDERLASLVATRAELTRKAESMRVVTEIAIAEMYAAAGLFVGNA